MLALTKAGGWLLGLGLLGCLVSVTIWSALQLTRSLAELEHGQREPVSHAD